ncbi:hypothetical protein FZ025_05225 [Xanthomonas hyacinthi]|uniref:Uncharacterized protein n=1 Tax=Xanthomonas hyacinthi TaxID=56455 RepID=A0A2S7F395_9XANT|nr:hypothetical protein [Xanthomonas hyacinthi]PPU99922.1 hypothetical protein XhyaCFBP1156_01880 [Xanthomonas hyacinthi]QGY76093.1 hypothetical protein FZ025_05225 [Xanthomonas hyacinthi]
MSNKTDHAGADAADDISSLFAKLGSQGASAYQDFSGARLSAPEPAAAAPPAVAPLPPAAALASAASAPTLSVVRAPAEPKLGVGVAPPAARPVAAEPAPAPLARPAAAEPALPASAGTATPLTGLFQRLLDSGRDRAAAPDSPLKRFQNR